ncbi:alkaline phosphatase D [Nocardiopsis sp. Huas11]|uniref:alkaline phosphatase D family protein n=1 Tax=Nocardiopsis sp. Huas11 TaxID=2183912 RepID=UPI000EAE71C7|nr:alkaline phosphatase D family protein [Nocardiopsis sp. Huas11]RKS08805.1 alkaline phosphatase D [Nocardiopsis sp. Huas11]
MSGTVPSPHGSPDQTPVVPSARTRSASAPATTRRQVLVGGAVGLGAAALVGLGAPAAHASPVRRGWARVSDPFTLGVASGDPLPDGVVLWTRLAPDPLAENGLGGMPDRRAQVLWQVSEHEDFRGITASGHVETGPEAAYSVHVEVNGLRPGADYFYRFRTGNEISPVGRTRTAPAPGSSPERFSFAFASCQNYTHGHYTAQAHLAQEDLDLVAFLGDYIYEGGGQGTIGRGHLPAYETTSLSDYRIRHAQYKTDEGLQAAHAAFPWAVVFDDHEVENNWADDTSYGEDVDPEEFLRRRARAFQAYYEHMPLRSAQRPHGPDLQLFRRLSFGDLFDLHLLDTRQYRSVQAEDGERDDPARTLLGQRQREWLFDGLANSGARWNVLAQQVFFSQRDFTDGDDATYSDDAWDNYRVERDSVRDRLASTANPVVVTGDVHANYVCDVKADFDDPDSATVATELVGTSFTSGGDGMDQRPTDAVQLQENPHIHYINRRRGYVRNVVTPTEWTADYRVVDYVSEPGAPIGDLARFVIDEGTPGVRPRG